jgi:hypothetical protein
VQQQEHRKKGAIYYRRGRYEEQITSTIGIASNEQYSPQLADFNPHTYYTSI